MPMPLFYRMTEGIRITARPGFVPGQSRPEARHWVFSYRIRLENVGQLPARLLSRSWQIRDASGRETEVEGEGVVGEQPTIPPGGVYEYQSFCILQAPRGWMSGSYQFVRPDGTAFAAAIPQFTLDAGQASRAG
ncbi:MAG: Co2+/Mg2+ efflux protein ApaG [Gemmatimonadetes bacterium]|nr:Co2+/Mg2+ efflux protein ApaG [Gemmatimonadota bacterium]MCB9504888.1 Co2+/Mg2+ efflux protein ApaG [Gemmatimonadales bacterium]MCA9762894.1 Co2+/Mg2+ efflux protein ApaG [Gemmatimonadota bacterium]MCB9518208.1 Co2+/Mg2+ efflux protein ApaG [Gemmatimonadales bacterium]HPF62760.1 Co2+/Mg2+ efflux protein ApaG [Gemmatimonadales bacterium]